MDRMQFAVTFFSLSSYGFLGSIAICRPEVAWWCIHVSDVSFRIFGGDIFRGLQMSDPEKGRNQNLVLSESHLSRISKNQYITAFHIFLVLAVCHHHHHALWQLCRVHFKN